VGEACSSEAARAAASLLDLLCAFHVTSHFYSLVRLIFHRNRRSRKDLIEGFDLFFVAAIALLEPDGKWSLRQINDESSIGTRLENSAGVIVPALVVATRFDEVMTRFLYANGAMRMILFGCDLEVFSWTITGR
jgi:hypothetical protein